MAFLDNSGDILLDAVLTDTGRKRMAEGTFNIKKFALGDEEIDYSLYNYDHPNGTAYYDTDILSTPILEATTDNAAGLKTKLLTITKTNLWYLPVMKLQTAVEGSKPSSKGNFYVPCDSANNAPNINSTTQALKVGSEFIAGVLEPITDGSGKILLHQGIDNTAELNNAMPPDLIETQYLLEIDNRLGTIQAVVGDNKQSLDTRYIDDDQIAAYLMSPSVTAGAVKYLSTTGVSSNIAGSKGTLLQFSVFPSSYLTSDNITLFTTLGGELQASDLGLSTADNFRYIDSFVRITGLTTGFRIDVPIRFLKLI